MVFVRRCIKGRLTCGAQLRSMEWLGCWMLWLNPVPQFLRPHYTSNLPWRDLWFRPWCSYDDGVGQGGGRNQICTQRYSRYTNCLPSPSVRGKRCNGHTRLTSRTEWMQLLTNQNMWHTQAIRYNTDDLIVVHIPNLRIGRRSFDDTLLWTVLLFW